MSSLKTPATALAVAFLLLPQPAAAQIPDKFTNLQVVRKDISKAELVMRMREIATELGLRCHNCHVGPDNLEGMDFASDEKPTKQAAREMLRMVESVGAVVSKLPAREEPRQGLGCFTCHRGAQRPPERLDVLLARTAQANGVEAALARYRELRREHASDGQYDFSPKSLGIAATRLSEAGRTDDAVALARLNVESHADVSLAHSQLGQLLLRKGDREAALQSFQRALKLDPNSAAAQRGIKAAAPSS
jgi:tetratricopeptide (TPR) repeat protein